jgi:hypothetical protein
LIFPVSALLVPENGCESYALDLADILSYNETETINFVSVFCRNTTTLVNQTVYVNTTVVENYTINQTLFYNNTQVLNNTISAPVSNTDDWIMEIMKLLVMKQLGLQDSTPPQSQSIVNTSQPPNQQLNDLTQQIANLKDAVNNMPKQSSTTSEVTQKLPGPLVWVIVFFIIIFSLYVFRDKISSIFKKNQEQIPSYNLADFAQFNALNGERQPNENCSAPASKQTMP